MIEVFPTASWTQWADRRGNRSRAAWSGAALGSLGLERVPRRRLSQDARDAIAAAVTARAFTHGRVQCFDEIVVPLEGLPATNRFVVVHCVFYCELEDERLLRVRAFFDLYDAAVQLGILPGRGTLGERALLVLRGFGLRAGRG